MILLTGFFVSGKNLSAQEVKGWVLHEAVINGKTTIVETDMLLLEDSGKTGYLTHQNKIQFNGTWSQHNDMIIVTMDYHDSAADEYKVIEKTEKVLILEKTPNGETDRLYFKRLG